MKLDKQIGTFSTGLNALIRVLNVIASVITIIMMLLVVSNIVARFIFRNPLLGTIEAVELLLVVVVFCALAYTETQRGHISVELVVARFPRRAKAIMAGIMFFIGAAVFVTMAWQAWELGWSHLFPKVFTTDLLTLPVAPFMIMIAFGSIVLASAMLLHVFNPLPPEKVEKDEIL